MGNFTIYIWGSLIVFAILFSTEVDFAKSAKVKDGGQAAADAAALAGAYQNDQNILTTSDGITVHPPGAPLSWDYRLRANTPTGDPNHFSPEEAIQQVWEKNNNFLPSWVIGSDTPTVTRDADQKSIEVDATLHTKPSTLQRFYNAWFHQSNSTNNIDVNIKSKASIQQPQP